MVITILCILIPLSFIAGGFIAYKGVQLGLRWQVEVKNEQPPTLTVPKVENPIAPFVEAKQEREQNSILAEWLHGSEESR